MSVLIIAEAGVNPQRQPELAKSGWPWPQRRPGRMW